MQPDLDAATDTAQTRTTDEHEFHVNLDNFSGPFDLLLSLISKHKLDITEIALAAVTDEFIAYLRAMQAWDLGQASEFLLVASTLLDLKAARLLPRGEVESEEDLELLEARDLLFARLLQYRAYREVADHLANRWESGARSIPRTVGLEPRFAALLPELVVAIGPDELAALAGAALSRQDDNTGIETAHLHSAPVPVPGQARLIVDRLRRDHSATFRSLVADAPTVGHVVARFLAVLELFRDGHLAVDQAESLGELTVRWTGRDDVDVASTDEYDNPPPVKESEPGERQR